MRLVAIALLASSSVAFAEPHTGELDCFLEVRRFAPEVPLHARPRVDAFPLQPREVVIPRASYIEPGLPGDAINRVIRAHAGSIRACYQRQLERDPDLVGRLEIQFEIAPDGSVRSSRVGKQTLDDHAVIACVQSTIMRLRFPNAPSKTVVTYPFLFSR